MPEAPPSSLLTSDEVPAPTNSSVIFLLSNQWRLWISKSFSQWWVWLSSLKQKLTVGVAIKFKAEARTILLLLIPSLFL